VFGGQIQFFDFAETGSGTGEIFWGTQGAECKTQKNKMKKIYI